MSSTHQKQTPTRPQSKAIPASKDAETKVMGYQRRLNVATADLYGNAFPYSARPFRDPISWYGWPLIFRERAMLAFLAQITEKPQWERKVFDETIVQKWRDERHDLEASIRATGQVHGFSETMFDCCIAELRDYAKMLDNHRMVPAIDATATVYKTDLLLSDDIKTALKAAVAPLEDVPAAEQDWHPDSDEKVLDLVHPSLYPLLYGRSRALLDNVVPLDGCLQYVGEGTTVPKPASDELAYEKDKTWGGRNRHPDVVYSSRFQWLPCEVDFSDDGATQITSYINNLHPVQHKELYGVLERVLAGVIPMWDRCLTSVNAWFQRKPRIDGNESHYADAGEPPKDELARLIEAVDPEEYGFDPEDREAAAREQWEHAHRVLVQPEPRYGHRLEGPHARDIVDLRKDFAHQGLQVIVKLANIHLTPEKPTYAGGSWHIEGSLNEHICASALYYYDSENITDSYLAFREAMDTYLDDWGYEQDDYGHIEKMLGITQHGPGIQELGRVLTKEGRLLAFPNVLQHRVEPFELADRSRPGHRKILALFLVDPYLRIPSTANVPPQQMEWWKELALRSCPNLGDLPPELAEQVFQMGDLPIDLQEAKRLRLELMQERKVFVEAADEKLHEATFSFCEH